MMKKSILFISIIAALSISACSNKEGGDEGHSAPERGSQVVDINFTDLKGNPVALSQFKGKVILLNFWATWCPPCREEMPALEELYKKFSTRPDFVMILVSVDSQAETAREFIARNKYTMPVYHDLSKEAGGTYGLTGVPETFFINKKGIIDEKILGPRDWMNPEVISYIEGLLKE